MKTIADKFMETLKKKTFFQEESILFLDFYYGQLFGPNKKLSTVLSSNKSALRINDPNFFEIFGHLVDLYLMPCKETKI